MNIVRTSGKGGRSEAALGPGHGRGGFPKIFPFSMAGADLPAFLGFRDRAFGFALVPVSSCWLHLFLTAYFHWHHRSCRITSPNGLVLCWQWLITTYHLLCGNIGLRLRLRVPCWFVSLSPGCSRRISQQKIGKGRNGPQWFECSPHLLIGVKD